MAAYSDIIATLGGSTSNSYVTGAAADQFAELQAWSADWLAKSESERTVALLSAAKWLDTVDFAGDRCSPSAPGWPGEGAAGDASGSVVKAGAVVPRSAGRGP